MAIELKNSLYTKMDSRKKKIVACGHSMGGSVAIILSLLFEDIESVYAFGAAPCIRFYPWKKHSASIRYIINESDPVTRFNFMGLYANYGSRYLIGESKHQIKHLGSAIYHAKDIIDNFKYHSMSEYLTKIKEGEGRWV